jgi:hypothetical protein
MKTDVVVARYREDLAWLGLLPPGPRVWVYNKGPLPPPTSTVGHVICLPNTGREAETFLHHIVTNYEDLADTTVFLQGQPFDHDLSMDDLRGALDGAAGSRAVSGTSVVCDRFGLPHHRLGIADLFGAIYRTQAPPTFRFSPGAQYTVRREDLQRPGKAFWERVYGLCMQRDEFPWEVERLWPLLFNARTQTSQTA